jgi:hypothetical protein
MELTYAAKVAMTFEARTFREAKDKVFGFYIDTSLKVPNLIPPRTTIAESVWRRCKNFELKLSKRKGHNCRR